MSTPLAHHFDDAEQQFDAARLGMWIFLGTEVMFFGGMFMGYTAYRLEYPRAFAEGSSLMQLVSGTVNTAVLLVSSFTIAMAIRSAQTNQRQQSVRLLITTMVLGIVFLGIKAYEYWSKYIEHHIPGKSFSLAETHTSALNAGVNPDHVELFFSFYFVLTGFHALHMIIGVVLVGVVCNMARQGRFSSSYYTPLEVAGLYWHFVDIIWVFLFPLLYLIH